LKFWAQCFFFLVYAGSGTGQSVLLIWADPEHRES
jgi:hypothetical protein